MQDVNLLEGPSDSMCVVLPQVKWPLCRPQHMVQWRQSPIRS